MVEYGGVKFGKLIAIDDLATEYGYRNFADGAEYDDVNLLERLYGLSLLFQWKNKIKDMY
ncbi:hypothetical protein PZN54_11245 [Staphylococcus capitis]|uniref:hypothetical protein n=1 Tax=Staphylococcus capitis TaxID=29388 RepID=UPI002480E35D|nr:hypothetical protein [Staphylococcus capitis]MDH9600712.1 hypothetical protein [Staphylococcus capitis]MDH9624374.1 hypothetical protein [Staphylococcus capitis]